MKINVFLRYCAQANYYGVMQVKVEITPPQGANNTYLKRGIFITRSIKPVFNVTGIDRDHTKCHRHDD